MEGGRRCLVYYYFRNDAPELLDGLDSRAGGVLLLLKGFLRCCVFSGLFLQFG